MGFYPICRRFESCRVLVQLKKTTEELVQERPAPEELLAMERTAVNVLVDNVRSLDNVGLLFRLCELARVERLYLTGYTGHPRVPDDEREEHLITRHEHRIFKTAVYAVPYQPWTYAQDPLPIVDYLKEAGHTIIALEQTDQSQPYHQIPRTEYQIPITLIAGHEREGVRQELINRADHVVEIPIRGLGNSHNVSHSVAIVLYHLLAQTGHI